MIDQIGEVGHGLVALVCRGHENFVIDSSSGGGIDDVNGPLPTIEWMFASALAEEREEMRVARTREAVPEPIL